MNYKEKLRKELENDPTWKKLCEAATPDQILQVNLMLDDLLSVAGIAASGFTTAVSKSSISDEQIAAAINEKVG
jgi:hypothetical protein